VLSLRAASAHADADHPWDGVWYLDASRSHFALHSFTFSRIANDMWRYDDGSSVCNFRPDGTPYPHLYAPDVTTTVNVSGTRTIDLVVSSYGRDEERARWMLATDGQSFAATDTRVYPDGHEEVFASKMARVGAGTGFEGRWKEAADSLAAKPQPSRVSGRRSRGHTGQASRASAPASSASASQPPRPYWVISTSVDSTMTWFIPATGELIRGRADGRPRPITGPQQPARRTFVWRQVTDRQLDFIASDSGHRIEFAVETLSADGAMLTDTLWAPGHESEKDVRVFRRSPGR
jgi:hypothetical protein